ncbi:phosphoserine phosphatase [Corynebacterium kutscheri]|uniref:HAD-superfamily subfamily IB hydrolase, TIGR01490 n=1 Tax=Corynebacterium kutscheri TaxID=35755 RepID=A0A0F6TCI8_9CORY|nr:HAD family hydrolase [Corynebacterium kutscheri]AKE40421.1 HAD-superfamily subfamily IB hydrolase, TIGR01490 [Corynebacterium kutscheri]VEH05237.1 phosphoserine phosphatase [Corynebacterium kutscheri]VEH10816.1 phosphoserine phosphatase [Corynebacterium kutscheri]VEH80705.1 phosphoserine phosphatase [Corynebacterium kutscheri]
MFTTKSAHLPARITRTAAFFDLDKTIIATNSAYAYGKELLNSGLISPATALEMYLAKTSYMFSGHSSEQMDASRDQLAAMITGWDVQQLTTLIEKTMHDVVCPAIYEEARTLIGSHLASGHDVVIVSASAREIVEPIAKELGVKQVVATDFEKKDGKFTGTILFYCKGAAKSEAIHELAQRNNYDLAQCFAYSDSMTDLPMLQTVGKPIAVNPDRSLRKYATENGWEIKVFRNPVPLIPMPSGKEIGISTGVLALVAALTLGGSWIIKRYR